MADIRIKDLATLESASLTGDVFVIDGTTGTRKLSAFSPSFGGNATVTGTLTANGGATVGGGSFAAASFYKSSSLGSVLSGATGSSYDLYITNPAGNYILQVPTGTRNAEFAGTLTTVGNATVGAALTVQATTASTTTSSGALVVGNGTSGGVGVGGAINAGGDIATAATMRSIGFHVPGNGAGRPASTDSYLASTATTQIPLYVSGYTGGGQTADILRVSLNTSSDWFAVKGNGQVACFATTASTSTSSGALVVSGGVGVAGAGFFGGNIVAAGNVVCGSATNQAVSIAGGTANDGGNVIVYGSTHASDPNTGRIRVGTTTITSWDSNDFTIASGKGLKVGNAYVAGAPTATGYIVIKDSTGTSYKIPAVAL